MKYFKIDLPIMMRLRVLDDLKIDLFNSLTDIIRQPVHFNLTGGYQTKYIATTYDLIGTSNGKPYIIRVYSRLDAETRISKPEYDRFRAIEEKGVFAYLMTFWEDELQVYRLKDRFPIIHDLDLYPGIFCEHVNNPEDLVDINGFPLCVDHGDAPVITLTHGDISIERDTQWVEPGYLAMDTEDGDLTARVEITGTVDMTTVGIYTLTYTVTDNDHNTVRAYREVSVFHINIPPVIALNATAGGDFTPVVINEGDEWNDPGATATDSEDGDLTNAIVVGGDAVLNNNAGSYNVIYSVRDSNNALAQVTRVVTVNHINLAPTITLNPGVGGMTSPIKIPQGGIWNDPGASAVDHEDGNLTPQILVTGDTVDTSVDGSYTITYGVTDSDGLSAMINRVVEIAMFPIITLLPTQGGETNNVTIYENRPWVDPGASAMDAEDGNITADIVVSGDVVDNTTINSYNIIYTVTDSDGLSISETRVVNVIALPQPLISPTGADPVIIFTELPPFDRYFKFRGHASYYGAGNRKTVLSEIFLPNTDTNQALLPPYSTYPSVYSATAPEAFDGDNSTDGTLGTHGTLAEVGFIAKSEPIDYISDFTITASQTISNSYNPPESNLGLSYQDVIVGMTPNSGTDWISLGEYGQQSWNPGESKTFNVNKRLWRNIGWVEPGYIANDPLDGDITADVTTDLSGINFQLAGTYSVTYNVVNSIGETDTKTRSVVVSDPTPPVITLAPFDGEVSPVNYVVGTSPQWVEPGYTAVDFLGNDITNDVTLGNTGIDFSVDNVHQIVYSVMDLRNQTTTIVRNINITASDNNAPVITLTGSNAINLQRHDQPSSMYYKVAGRYPGGTAYNGKVVLAGIEILNADNVNMLIPPYSTGNLWTDNPSMAFDGDATTDGWVHFPGNLSDTTGFVAKSISPVDHPTTLVLTASTDIHNDYEPPEAPYIMFQKKLGDVPPHETQWHRVDPANYGDYVWTPGEVKTEAIPATGMGGYYGTVFGAWNEPGYNATDVEDGNITADVVISGDTPDLYVPGVYTITYSVTDSAGATTTTDRLVTVVDRDDPVVTVLGDNPFTVNSGHQWVDEGATAVDADGNPLVIETSLIYDDPSGDSIIYYATYDIYGLTSVSSRLIIYELE